jgi:hypothetical protein
MRILSGKLFTILLLFFVSNLTIAQNAGLPASDLFGRKYKTGDKYRYKLTMDEFHDGKWDHTNISICELKVVKDSIGIPCDEIHWISRTTINAKDTIDATKAALSVKPYFISLDPKGKIDFPLYIFFPAFQIMSFFFNAGNEYTGSYRYG